MSSSKSYPADRYNNLRSSLPMMFLAFLNLRKKEEATINFHAHRLALIKNALSPIRTLPIEILSLIFQYYIQHCRDADVGLDYPNWDESIELNQLYYQCLPPAVLLSHVCSSWWRIALHLPSIWTYFPIYAMPENQRMPDQSLLEAWLKRSDPLCVDLDIKTYNDENTLQASYLDCLLPSSARWRTLNLRVPYRLLRHLLQRTEEILAPEIEMLEINVVGTYPSHPIFSALKTAHKLREFTFINPRPRADIWSLFELPTHQITVLELSGSIQDPDAARRVITSCPLLEECFVLLSDYENFPQFGAPVVLPKLELFFLAFDGVQGSPHFLGAFTMPRLTHLELQHLRGDREFHDDIMESISVHLMSLQARSVFRLKFLILCNLVTDQLSADELLQFLHAVPSVEELCISKCIVDLKRLAVDLTADPQRKTCAPNLTRISITDDTGDELEEVGTTVTEMVVSRWKPYHPETDVSDGDVGMIKWPVAKLVDGVYLWVDWPFAESDIAKLEECNSEGMPLIL